MGISGSVLLQLMALGIVVVLHQFGISRISPSPRLPPCVPPRGHHRAERSLDTDFGFLRCRHR